MNTQPAAQASPSLPPAPLEENADSPRPPQRLVLELPSRLADAWSGRHSLIVEPAVVTVGWVDDVAVIAVLLKHRLEHVALVLDPCEPIVASAVECWSRDGKLLLRVGQADRLISEEARVRVDGLVESVVAHMHGRQGQERFRRAVAEYFGVQRLLNRLAGTHHIRWAEALPAAVLAGAR